MDAQRAKYDVKTREVQLCSQPQPRLLPQLLPALLLTLKPLAAA